MIRSEVLKLYRDFVRLTYKVKDQTQRQELQKWIRSDFDANRHHANEQAIKMQLTRGKHGLRELEQTVMLVR